MTVCSQSIRRGLAAFCCGLLAISAAGAAEDRPRQAPLTLKGPGPWYQLRLDAQTQMLSRSLFSGDVRIVDSEGKEQPYTFFAVPRIRTVRQQPEVQTVEAQLYPLKGEAKSVDMLPNIQINRQGDNVSISVAGTEDSLQSGEKLSGYILDTQKLDGDSMITEMIIDWQAPKDGFYSYSLAVSDDMATWRSIGGGKLYRLTAEGRTLENNGISDPENQMNYKGGRFIRLLWNEDENAPEITGVKITYQQWYSYDDEPVFSWTAPLVAKRLEGEENGKQAVYEWKFPIIHYVNDVSVMLPAGNILLPYMLSGRSDESHGWQRMAVGTLTQINAPQAAFKDITVGHSLSELRLVLNGYAPEELTLKLAMGPENIVFFAQGKAPYFMQTGFANRHSEALMQRELLPDPYDEHIGSAQFSAAFESLPDAAVKEEMAEPDFNWKLLPLWGFLVVGAGFLGWIAVSLLRKSANLQA